MTEDEARPAGDGFFKVVKTIILPIFRGLFRMKIDGADNVPAAGGVILAGNHRDFSDPVALLAATRRTVHFLAMKELFRGPGKWLFKHLGAIPVDRSKKHSNGGSLAVAKEKLLQGQAVGIFPEGKRNKTDARILPLKYGAVKLASQTGAPIVPLAITGHLYVFAGDLRVKFGRPFLVKPTDDLDKANQKLSDEIVRLMR